ncbi:MAG: AmmeMemoRadiSam system protein A [bacterium]
MAESRELNNKEQNIALQIARQSIAAIFDNKDYQPQVKDYPIFKTKRGVFVTLRKDGGLRGCIGTFDESKPLAQTIQEMAVSAAFADPRFNQLSAAELDEIKIEISVLSPMENIDDPGMIETGKHGVYVQKGSKGGVYLPQVASEEGWNREQFLSHLCEHKAGIGRDSWRDGSAQIYIFTAQVFQECVRWLYSPERIRQLTEE